MSETKFHTHKMLHAKLQVKFLCILIWVFLGKGLRQKELRNKFEQALGEGINLLITSPWKFWFEVEVKVNLRPTVSRPVCLGVRLPSGTRDQFFLQTVSGLLFCSTLSDERTGLKFTVQLLLGLARAATLGSKSRRTHRHILLYHLRLPSTWRARSPYLYSPGTGWPSYTPGHWVPFLSPLTTRRAAVEVF
jgi:hypothetical protein